MAPIALSPRLRVRAFQSRCSWHSQSREDRARSPNGWPAPGAAGERIPGHHKKAGPASGAISARLRAAPEFRENSEIQEHMETPEGLSHNRAPRRFILSAQLR